MEIIEKTRGVARSAAHSAAVSYNAASDMYTLTEAVRKGTDEELLQQAAATYRLKHGCSATEAFIQIGKRAEYLQELAAGESTFREAKKQIDVRRKKQMDAKATQDCEGSLNPA